MVSIIGYVEQSIDLVFGSYSMPLESLDGKTGSAKVNVHKPVLVLHQMSLYKFTSDQKMVICKKFRD